MTPENKRRNLTSQVLAQLHNSTYRGEKLKKDFVNNMKMLSSKIDMAMVACDMKDADQLERLRMECESHLNIVFDGFREGIRLKQDGEDFVEGFEKQLKDI